MTWYRKEKCPICDKEMMPYETNFKPKKRGDEKFANKIYFKCDVCQKFFMFLDEVIFMWDITRGWLIYQERFVFR
jgi:transposase-like protein